MVSLGLIVFVGVGAILLGLGLRGYLAPAAKETAIIVSDVQALRNRLNKDDAKDAEKGER